MMKFLKFKKEIEINVNTKYDKYLYESSIETSGTVDYNEDFYVTWDKKKYVLYSYEFIIPSELSNMIALKNRENLTNLFKVLKGCVKCFNIREKEKPMSESFQYYLNIYRSVKEERKKRLLAEELDLLKACDEKEYITKYIMIEHSQEKIFLERSHFFLNVKKIDKEQGEKILYKQNNNK